MLEDKKRWCRLLQSVLWLGCVTWWPTSCEEGVAVVQCCWTRWDDGADVRGWEARTGMHRPFGEADGSSLGRWAVGGGRLFSPMLLGRSCELLLLEYDVDLLGIPDLGSQTKRGRQRVRA
jgi:hypothetical protein